MARKSKKVEPEHNHLSLTVESFRCNVGGGINYELYTPRDLTDETPLFRFDSHIEIQANCIYPDDRIDNTFTISVYGQDDSQQDYAETLSKYQVQDKHGSPKYRKRGENLIPLFEPPETIGFINKAPKEMRWQCAAWVPNRVTLDMQTLFALKVPLYVVMHEVRTGKRRAVRSIHLQTYDPDEG